MVLGVFLSFDGPAKSQPDNYYHQYAIGNRADATAMAKDAWKKTNLKNLKEYILPTKNLRRSPILHKTVGHHIDVQIKNISTSITQNFVDFYNHCNGAPD